MTKDDILKAKKILDGNEVIQQDRMIGISGFPFMQPISEMCLDVKWWQKLYGMAADIVPHYHRQLHIFDSGEIGQFTGFHWIDGIKI